MSDILELLDELDALEKFNKPRAWKDAAISSAYPAMSAKIRRLQAKNERMLEALKWYGNEENYTIAHAEYDGVIIDGGERARRALEEADVAEGRMKNALDSFGIPYVEEIPCPKCGGTVGHRVNCPDGIAFSEKEADA